jgi:Phage integrase, N-terminal SAM-like domain
VNRPASTRGNWRLRLTKLGQLATEVANGSPVECQKLTLGDFLDRWLGTIKQSVAPTTHGRYESSVNHQLKPYLGGIRLAKLEPVHVAARS